MKVQARRRDGGGFILEAAEGGFEMAAADAETLEEWHRRALAAPTLEAVGISAGDSRPLQ